MQGKTNRMDKVNGEFQKSIYEIISRKLKNPFITEMVSVLDVETSKDLRHAKVYISIYSKSEEKKNLTFKAICDESKKIRHELALMSNFKTVPELSFVMDTTMEYGDKIEKLFIKINDGKKDN